MRESYLLSLPLILAVAIVVGRFAGSSLVEYKLGNPLVRIDAVEQRGAVTDLKR